MCVLFTNCFDCIWLCMHIYCALGAVTWGTGDMSTNNLFWGHMSPKMCLGDTIGNVPSNILDGTISWMNEWRLVGLSIKCGVERGAAGCSWLALGRPMRGPRLHDSVMGHVPRAASRPSRVHVNYTCESPSRIIICKRKTAKNVLA